MHKLWLVAKREYLRRVGEKSFLFMTLGFPLLIIGVSVVAGLVAAGGRDARPIGYVDQAGLLDRTVLPSLVEDRPSFTTMEAFANEDAARLALGEGRIAAYYVMPGDYLQRKELTLTYDEDEPRAAKTRDFSRFVRASLVARQPSELQDVLEEGLAITIRSTDGRRVMSEGGIPSFLVPFVVTFFLFFAISTAGGYLLQAMTEEKENRTMEILATSVSPEQLMAGKALGLIAVSLTQILIWLTGLFGGLWIGGRFVSELQGLQLPWDMVIVTVLYFLPSFVLIAGIMIAIGGAVTEQQQGQQVAGIINLLFIVPMFFLVLIFENPESPLLVGLTLFPTTAFLTVLLRWGMTSVPMWQLVLSWVLLALSALGSIWVAARVFRIGMLQYGQRLSLKTIVQGLRGQPVVRSNGEAANHA